MQNEKAEATVMLEKTSHAASSESTDVQSGKKTKLRAFPLWLRILVFLVVLIVVALAGLLVGYSMLGGGEAADVVKLSTWEHIFNIMNGKE